MSKTAALNLLPATNPKPDGSDTIGTPQKAAAYYTKNKSLQTISWYYSEFVGMITLEATLDTDSATANYATVAEIEVGEPTTNNDFINLTGNYTWIRATVKNHTNGTVLKVVLGY